MHGLHSKPHLGGPAVSIPSHNARLTDVIDALKVRITSIMAGNTMERV